MQILRLAMQNLRNGEAPQKSVLRNSLILRALEYAKEILQLENFRKLGKQNYRFFIYTLNTHAQKSKF